MNLVTKIGTFEYIYKPTILLIKFDQTWQIHVKDIMIQVWANKGTAMFRGDARHQKQGMVFRIFSSRQAFVQNVKIFSMKQRCCNAYCNKNSYWNNYYTKRCIV